MTPKKSLSQDTKPALRTVLELQNALLLFDTSRSGIGGQAASEHLSMHPAPPVLSKFSFMGSAFSSSLYSIFSFKPPHKLFLGCRSC